MASWVDKRFSASRSAVLIGLASMLVSCGDKNGTAAPTDAATDRATDTAPGDSPAPADRTSAAEAISEAPDAPWDAPAEVGADLGRDGIADRGADGSGDAWGTDTRPSGIATRPANPTCKPPANPSQPPSKLSDTGCFDPADPKKPGAMLIPFGVASPLWSDNADKERYVALPDGARIHIKDCQREPATCADGSAGGTPEDEGHFGVPIGTVFVKTFKLQGRFIETRLLVRVDDLRWGAYSYEWNEAQTEATVLPDAVLGVTKSVHAGSAMQNWFFPSRNQCFECHTRGSGVSLGATTQQLNHDLTYPSAIRANQIDTWETIGLFDAPVRRLPVLATPQSTVGTVTDRARSYLHTNCSICHRPQGGFESIDLRVSLPLERMNICNVLPERGNAGIAGALLLIPNDPAKSLMSIRMRLTDNNRMPKIASSIVDATGVNVVEAWIRSLQRCP